MLRCVFVGSRNRFTELIAHWLSKNSLLTGVVWTTSADWGKSFSGRIRFARKRLDRFGVLKTADEGLYYALAKTFLKPAGEPFQSRLWEAYVREHGSPDWQGESIETDSINSSEAVAFVRERSTDLIMSMCISEFFRRELRQTPRLGAFLWHEGICPEYRGLYSPFWAVHNREPEMLGYSVLKMNERYDESEVYLQGPVSDVDPRRDSFVYIGHKAILDSLPAVAQMFQALENGTARAMTVEGRQAASYTYPGLTDWIRSRMRLRTLVTASPKQRETGSILPVKGLEGQ